MAILVRRNADADPFLRALNTKQIPYRFSGSRGLYAQEEIKNVVSFIRALTDFEDGRSLFFLAHSEIYAAGMHDLTVISNYSQKKNLPLHRVFEGLAGGTLVLEISPETVALVRTIHEDLVYFVGLSGAKNAGQVVYAFLEKTGYLKKLVEALDPGGRAQDQEPAAVLREDPELFRGGRGRFDPGRSPATWTFSRKSGTTRPPPRPSSTKTRSTCSPSTRPRAWSSMSSSWSA